MVYDWLCMLRSRICFQEYRWLHVHATIAHHIYTAHVDIIFTSERAYASVHMYTYLNVYIYTYIYVYIYICIYIEYIIDNQIAQ